MADFTYSGDPKSCDQDAVRFLLGDTNENDIQFTDREIEFLLDGQSNVYLAASNGAHAIAAKYGRLVDISVGDLSYSYSQRQKQYTDLATSLQRRAVSAVSTTSAMPYAGGISIADKDAVKANSDRVPPAFHKGMHDYDTTVDED